MREIKKFCFLVIWIKEIKDWNKSKKTRKSVQRRNREEEDAKNYCYTIRSVKNYEVKVTW